ncbi:hypothetical protein GCM10009118_22600 [Wandonia haliotis]|uniref:RHS repeat-associated core domain-containing protein n=2 Tax=Wandonia haliotis TaxID=574963 RepID=A0ABP3Y2V1_9FLAO
MINDRKMWNATDGNYDPVILSWSDYYAFGMTMPGRNGGADYRYLFNGMEHDGEVSGNGNSYTTEFRQYDPRLGRWKSLAPLMTKFPNMSPYVDFANNPVYFTDPYGLESVNYGGDGGGDAFPENPNEGDDFMRTDAKGTEWHYKYENGVWVGQGGDGGVMNDVEVSPRNKASYENAKASNKIDNFEYLRQYKLYDWCRFDPNCRDIRGTEEQRRALQIIDQSYEDAATGLDFAIKTSLIIGFAPLAIETAPTWMPWDVNGARTYHTTFCMRGGYQSFTLDFTIQTVLNPDANLSLYSSGSSFFIPGGLSFWKVGLWETSTTMIKVDVKEGVIFRAYDYYGFSQNSSSFIMNSYGNRRFGTPFLGIYFQMYHNYLIGEFERKNSQQGEK